MIHSRILKKLAMLSKCERNVRLGVGKILESTQGSWIKGRVIK